MVPELAAGVGATILAFARLVAGSPTGSILNALLLVLGFFILLVLSGTRSRATHDRADWLFSLAFFIGTLTYAAILGARLSADAAHLTSLTLGTPYLSTFTILGRAAYVLLLAAGTVAALPATVEAPRRRVVQAACALVVVLVLADRYDRLTSSAGLGPLTGAPPRPLHLALHVSQVGLCLAVLYLLAARARRVPVMLAVSWTLLLLADVSLAGEHVPDRAMAINCAMLSQFAFLLHVPSLFVAMALRDRQLLFDASDRLRMKVGALVGALLSLEEASDANLRLHSQRHAELARSLAERLGMSKDDVENVFWAALLHDIGKISLDRSLFSRPRPLTSEEWAMVQKHPVLGAKVLEGVPGLETVIAAVRHHHERWDGSGYPDGLRALSIPIGARIVAVVDAFDAMLSSRAYRRPRSLLDAVEEVRSQAGKHFDPAVVGAFLDVLDEQGLFLVER